MVKVRSIPTALFHSSCNQEQTLEAMISDVLSKVRGDVGNICMQELSRHNAPLIMATCGSKGE